MKKTVLLILILSLPIQSFCETLESELKSLNFDKSEKIPAGQSTEKLYSIQSRVISLDNRNEILLGGGQNLTGDSFLVSRQASLEDQFHFNDKWAVALAYSKAENKWSSSTQKLIDQNSLVPDVDYLKSRTEFRLQYNTFYGKLRVTRDSIFYFDQYVALGYASNELASGNSGGPVIDVGFSNWISNYGSIHWGLKDYSYQERGQLSSGFTNNIFAYIQAGYLF